MGTFPISWQMGTDLIAALLTMLIVVLAYWLAMRLGFYASTPTGQITAVAAFAMLIVLAPLWIPLAYYGLGAAFTSQLREFWSLAPFLLLVVAYKFGAASTLAGIAGGIAYLVTRAHHQERFRRMLKVTAIVAAIALVYPVITWDDPVA
jgi:hypothetical protein